MSSGDLTLHKAIESEEDIAWFADELRKKLADNQRPVATLTWGKKIRTLAMNRALHQFLQMLADGLNDAGLDMKKVLKPEVEIPWTKDSAKEYLWRPLQKVLIDEESTADASTSEYTPVYQTLCRHLAAKFGFRAPDWPSKRG